MKIKNLLSQIKISEIYYVPVVIGYMLTLAFQGMRPGVFATVLMLLVASQLLILRKLRIRTLPDILALVFFSYQILSVIWLLKGGFPFHIFLAETVASVLPMVFYFVGRDPECEAGRWYRNYLIAMLILGIAGVILYAFAPQFYNEWSVAMEYTSKADAATTRVRMNSVVGSTVLSFLMVTGMLCAAFFLKKDPDGNGDADDAGIKVHGIPGRIFGAVCMALCLLFAILANQRSGLVAAALVIVYVNLLIFFVLKLLPKKFFWIELALITVFVILVGVVRFDFLLKYWYRVVSLPSAISERSEQWVAAVNNMYSTWLGNGTGANSHHALGIEGAHVIADGGLIKLYCETGVVGFSMWVFLLILACKKGIEDLSSYYTELGIVAVGLLQSIGSNMLAFQLCAPVFWFAIGRLSSKYEKAS